MEKRKMNKPKILLSDIQAIMHDIFQQIEEMDLSPTDEDCEMCKETLNNEYYDIDENTYQYDLNSFDFKKVFIECCKVNQLFKDRLEVLIYNEGFK